MIYVEIPRQYDDIDGIMKPLQNTKLFGHDKIIEFFTKMREEGRLHHALLFEGVQGIGKATLAFHLAYNLISLQDKAFVRPDMGSPIWRQMAQGSNPGLLHISRRFDTKTEKFKTAITVEDIRQINHITQQTMHDGGWRVVVIDSADDMNRNAANAILKTLEEPPAKTLFILISHFAGRLLPTIRSRCQTVDFRALNDQNMRQALGHILPDQLPNEDGLAAILQKAQGSVRKATLLLCYGGLEIIKEQDEILNQPIFDPIRAQNLGQILSGRDSTIQFVQFCEDMVSRISDKARQYAEEGNIDISYKYAMFWQDILQEITQAEAYNLDKKQLVINLMAKTHQMMQQKP